MAPIRLPFEFAGHAGRAGAQPMFPESDYDHRRIYEPRIRRGATRSGATFDFPDTALVLAISRRTAAVEARRRRVRALARIFLRLLLVRGPAPAPTPAAEEHDLFVRDDHEPMVDTYINDDEDSAEAAALVIDDDDDDDNAAAAPLPLATPMALPSAPSASASAPATRRSVGHPRG